MVAGNDISPRSVQHEPRWNISLIYWYTLFLIYNILFGPRTYVIPGYLDRKYSCKLRNGFRIFPIVQQSIIHVCKCVLLLCVLEK